MNIENLWAPWRMVYLRGLEKRAKALAADTVGEVADDMGNFLAYYWTHPEGDEAHNVVYRNDRGMILLNRYPYSNGHLLVALGEARPNLLDYDPDQRAAFWKLMELATDLMQRTINPHGINLGINQGEAAGAGLPNHLHGHLVPRWPADTNFITVLGTVRVIPDSLETMADAYRATLATMNGAA